MTRYGRLCTEFYDIDKPEAPPDAFDFFRAFAKRAGGPILEPMCGSGRFLLPLLAEGLDIEGADTSEEMLAACRRHAVARGLSPVLHDQALEHLALSRRFALVFIPIGSFCLLTQPSTVRRSLKRIYEALLPGGRFLVEIERASDRPPSQSGNWGGRWVERVDGAKIVLSWLNQHSGVENVTRSVHRYELVRGGKLLETEFEDFELKFYEVLEFTQELERAGFTRIEAFKPYELRPADESDEAIVFSCIRPEL